MYICVFLAGGARASFSWMNSAADVEARTRVVGRNVTLNEDCFASENTVVVAH